jgi:hypothetical protein
MPVADGPGSFGSGGVVDTTRNGGH